MTVALVALAAAAGVLSGYGLVQAVVSYVEPLSWLVVNVVGSFAIGVLAGAGASSDVRTVVGVGFLGGFTTFSTFSLDVFADLEAGRPGRAVAYVVLSVGLGIGAAAAGWALARA